MGKIVDDLNKVMQAENKKMIYDEEFHARYKYYLEMKEKGLIVQQKYNIPVLDTVGKRLHQAVYKNG